MLIAKIFVNQEQIDELRILNTGIEGGIRPDGRMYEIQKPVVVDKFIWHYREDGYEVLLKKALKRIIEEKEDEKTNRTTKRNA